MWKCPKCNREFKRTNQSHYCGEAPKTIDEYILNQPVEIQEILNQVRITIRDLLPNVKEKISWGMPTYWEGQNIIHFAASKNHLGLYPGEEAIIELSDKLLDYKTTKGAIQFPYKQEIPFDLISQITLWCYETGNHH